MMKLNRWRASKANGFPSLRGSRLAGAFAIVAIGAASSASAANHFWNDSSTNFNSAGSWTIFGGTDAPAASDLTVFPGAVTFQPQLTLNTSVSGLHVNNPSGSVTLTALNPGTTFTVGSNGLYNGSSGQTLTLNHANFGLILGNSATFTGDHTISIGSALSGFDLGNNALTLGGTGSGSSIAKAITSGGTGSLLKSGSGTWTLSAANSFTGGTTVSAGTIKFTGAGNTIGAVGLNGGTLQIGVTNALVNTTSVTLNGGTLQIADGAFSQSFGTTALNLTASSTIDLGFGLGASTLAFGASNLSTWTGTLAVVNYNVGSDTLRFGSDNTALTAGQLSQILINGQSAQWAGSDGSVSPVPEPSTYAAIVGAFALSAAIYRRRNPGSKQSITA